MPEPTSRGRLDPLARLLTAGSRASPCAAGLWACVDDGACANDAGLAPADAAATGAAAHGRVQESSDEVA
ncbi:MAG: hypothetical protein ACPIOQ_01890 [Promethearchaeia archaeon]